MRRLGRGGRRKDDFLPHLRKGAKKGRRRGFYYVLLFRERTMYNNERIILRTCILIISIDSFDTKNQVCKSQNWDASFSLLEPLNSDMKMIRANYFIFEQSIEFFFNFQFSIFLHNEIHRPYIKGRGGMSMNVKIISIVKINIFYLF